MINKRQEYKQLVEFLTKTRKVTKLYKIERKDLEAYVATKREKGLKATSIISMAKQVIAFFNWCVKEELLEENPTDRVTLPKVPKKRLEGFTSAEIGRLINCFTFDNYLEARNKGHPIMISITFMIVVLGYKKSTILN